MLTMDDRFCSSVDFSDCDDESGGPSIDFEELWDILRENPGASSQNTPEGLLTEQVPSCESVPDVASQQSFPIQTGLQELKVEPSPGEISGSVAFFSLCTSEASMSRARCSDESLQPSRNFMVSDHGNSKLPSQIGSPLASYSGSCKELVHVGPVHDTWCFDGGETFSHVPYSSRNVGREAQYEIPSDNTMFSSFAGDANQVPDYTDNFGLDYFNSEVNTSNVDCGNPFFSENSMGFSGASENYSCTSMEISLINANISSQHAAHAQSSISQVSDGMCRAGNQYSEMPCCVGDNDNHLVDPLRQFPCNRVSVQFIPNRGYINTKDEKEEYLTDRASMQVERASSSVSDLSGIVYSDAKGFSSNCDRSNDTQPSCGNSLLHADSELIDEMVIAKPWVHPQSRIPIKKPKACIKEERSEVAHENVTCHSADASNCDVTKKFHPVSDDGLIPEKGSKMLVAGIRPSISTAKRVVTAKVEKVDAFVASKQNCPSQDLLDETHGITLSNGDLNRSAAGHAVQISEPSHVCKQYDFTRDEKEGEAKHPKNMASHLSKVSPESTQSNSLDNRSLLADDENDICILEEISQPPRSLTMTYRKCLAPPQRSTYNDPIHHMGVGGMRLRAGDEQLILQGALQDLSQPKSETSPPDGALAVPLLRHQRIALSWMVNKEIAGWNCVGGILADDQGLGKTISTIALILKERPPSSRVCQKDMKQGGPEALNLDEDHDEIRDFDVMKQDVGSSQLISIGNPVKSGNALLQSKGRPSAGTLVVCPTSVLRQWADELQNKVTSKTRLSVLVYHGSNRTKDPCELAKFDVVLTTYSIVSMEVPKQPLVDKDEDEKGNPEAGVSSIGMCSSRKRKYPPSSNKRGLKSGKAGDDTFVEPIIRPLAKVQWFRVVLDEAQSIKNYRTQVARACWGLRAKRRWCLSGTPIQNAVDDLYSYFRFLKYDPYAAYKTFCEKIKVPINKNPTKGYKKLQAVLKTIMLRRTKGTRLDGEPIITLPPKSIELRKVDFSIEERDFYTRLEADSRAQFEEYAAAGTVKQNYVNILLMLLRLRQACDHRLLVKGYDSYSVWKSSSDSVRKLPRERQNCLLRCLEASLAICGICNDPPEDAVVSICGHVFCNQCICEHLAGDDNHCPASNCKVQLNVSSVFSKATLNSSLSDESILNTIPDFSGSEHAEPLEPLFPCSESCSFDSSKIKAALEVLESLSKPRDSRVQCDTQKTSDCEILCDPQSDELLEDMPTNKRNLVANKASEVGEKAIVFSQWTRMLDLLEACLKNSSIQYRRLDGTMTVAARDKAVKDFNTRPEVSVMIMSLKAASLGLNMVAACHVLLMDLWWNPTTEDQAIDRAHRIGQTRPVTVVRLTVKDTVEDRILALQQKKREMVASAFGEDETGSQQSRLTVEDLKYLFMV